MRKSHFVTRLTTALALAAILVTSSIPFSSIKTVEAAGATNKTATQVVADMTVGFNIGNTMDAKGGSFPASSSNETSWGNPKITKEFVEAIGKQGFNTVRLPVSWGQYTTGSNYQIPDWWMTRVKEVVDYCIDNGMYVILNTHHDTDFYSPTNAKKAESEKFFKCVWTQVATAFKDYDSHLVFETMNEPRLVGHSEEWWFPRNNPSSDIKQAVACINSYNQVALDAIRATGGNNATRCVMVPGYDASYDGALVDGFKMPTDKASNRLILSVHAYTPYDFTLNANGTSQFTDRASIDSLFNDLNAGFLSKGIPVVIGEMGASNKNNTSERVKWADYYWGTAKKYSNVAMCLWDNNILNNPGDPGECHRYFDRNTGAVTFPEIFEVIVKHVDGTPAKSAGESGNPTPVDPTPVDPTPVDPTPVDPTPVDPTPSETNLAVSYKINNWGSEYQVIFNIINNTKTTANDWKLTLKKSEIKIDASWNISIKETSDSYIITPVGWNATIASGSSIEFGIQGKGQIGSSLTVSLNGENASTPADPTPVDPAPVDPTPVDPTPTIPTSDGLSVATTFDSWGSGFQYNITIKNDGNTVDTWEIRVKKSDIKINSAWCVNLVEENDTYVITPLDYNSRIEKGKTVSFGLQGSGNNSGKTEFVIK